MQIRNFHQQSLVSRERLRIVKVENGRCSFAHIEFSYYTEIVIKDGTYWLGFGLEPYIAFGLFEII